MLSSSRTDASKLNFPGNDNTGATAREMKVTDAKLTIQINNCSGKLSKLRGYRSGELSSEIPNTCACRQTIFGGLKKGETFWPACTESTIFLE
ncbi:MAG: hypothetical protein GY763_08650 [Gammaproteobacteria bacterium]|nr:hypothetical protein [Gammaproteobacteria bacterium]